MDRLRRLYLSTIGVEEPLPRSTPLKGKDKPPALDEVRGRMGECRRCPLGARRTTLVFGAGDPAARVVFVGEAPGKDEDEQGIPFVGLAGQLLTKIIAAMGLDRDQVYICNVLKCRPPGNRDPLPEEVDACSPFLREQLLAIAPRVLVTLGAFPARTLLATDARISALRGRFHAWEGIPLMPTWHPSYLLRNPAAKRDTWEDVRKVMDLLGTPAARR